MVRPATAYDPTRPGTGIGIGTAASERSNADEIAKKTSPEGRQAARNEARRNRRSEEDATEEGGPATQTKKPKIRAENASGHLEIKNSGKRDPREDRVESR